MAQGVAVKIFAGYRSSDSDRVSFRDESALIPIEATSAVRLIDPSQLVTVGNAFHGGDEADCDESRVAGEWGRSGPRQRLERRELWMIPAETALTIEDAAARHIPFESEW